MLILQSKAFTRSKETVRNEAKRPLRTFKVLVIFCSKGLCNNYLEGGSKISKVGLTIKLHPP